jgi:hypothetical protein
MDLAKKLQKQGYSVQVFNEYHLRVNEELDLFPNSKGRSIAWHDRYLNTRGRVPEDQVVFFAKNHINGERTSQAEKESFIKTLTDACGWTLQEAEKEWTLRQQRS